MVNPPKFIYLFLLVALQFSLLFSKEPKFTVHLIIHSHVDAGWVITFEKLYQEKAKKILRTMTECLYANESYRLNWADQLFLDRWWFDPEVEQGLKDQFLVVFKRGQVQFVHPGMVMTDEAMVSFGEALDNYQVGRHFLRDVFGEVPHVAWALDPFGLTSFTPALMNKFNLDTIYLSRTSLARKDYLWDRGYEAFFWEGDPINGVPSKVFTLVSQFGTYTPSKLAYDIEKKDRYCKLEDLDEMPPKKCLKALYDEAIRDIVDPIIADRSIDSPSYPVPILLGDDGAFQDAYFNFRFLDRFIEVFNKHAKGVLKRDLQIRYSTFDEYLSELKQTKQTFPVYRGDFFPEIEIEGRREDNAHYWNGYYSNYPVYKTLVRQMFKKLHQTQTFLAYTQIHNFLSRGSFLENGVRLLEAEIVGIVNLHHDAVTGTHTVNVNYDYVDKIARSVKYADQQNQITSAKIEELFGKKSMFDEVPKSLMENGKPTVMKVFNPDVKAAINETVNVTVSQFQYYLAVDDELNFFEMQALPISYYDNYDKVLSFNISFSDLFILIPKIPAFSLKKIFLFTYSSQSECYQLYRILSSTNNDYPSHTCFSGHPFYNGVFDSPAEPVLEVTTPSAHFKLTLHNTKGLISSITQNGLTMHLRQDFQAYIHFSESNSGFYLFDPNRPPKYFNGLEIIDIYHYEGELFACLHVFLARAQVLDTLYNAYFENKVCVQKQHLERVLQQVNSKSIIGYEIILKTQLLSSAGELTDSELKFYTHDSLYAVERKAFSKEEAEEKHMLKTQHEKGQPDIQNLDGFWQTNSYPCNTGLIVEDEKEKVALGFSYQHGLMCQMPFNHTWYIMLTRATQNPHFQQGIHDQQDDFDYTRFGLSFTISSIKEDKDFSQFIDTWNQLDFHQNMGLMTIIEPLNETNSKKLDGIQQILGDNQQLRLVKAYFDEHAGSVHLIVHNNHDYPIPLQSFDFGSAETQLEVFTCEADDVLACTDSSYYDQKLNMLDGSVHEGYSLSGTRFEIFRYNIFELNHKQLQQDPGTTSDPNTLPPFSIATISVRPTQVAELAIQNHYNDPARKFYFSQRKYVQQKLAHLTCFNSFAYLMLALFYGSFCFMIYALYLWFWPPKEALHRKE